MRVNKRQRSIDLPEAPPAPVVPGKAHIEQRDDGFTRWEVRGKYVYKTYVYRGKNVRERVVKRYRREIRLKQLRKYVSVEVIYDSDMTPWGYCDGYQHSLVDIYDYISDSSLHTEVRQSRAWCFGANYRESGILRLEDAEYSESLYKYYRQAGASRQVAAELVAADRRRRLDQLKEWYTHGWTDWHVSVDHPEYSDSVTITAVDEDDPYRQDIIDEMLIGLASWLERRGHIVHGLSELLTQRQQESKRHWRTGRMHGFDWRD